MELLFLIFVIVFLSKTFVVISLHRLCETLTLLRKNTLLLHVPYSSISLCHHLLDIFQ